MKMIVLAAMAAVMASPVAAEDFTGVRAEVTAGADDVTNGVDLTDVNYGVGVGVDAAVYPNVIVGVEANIDNVFDRRNIGASARVGYVVNDSTLVYAKAGYANWRQTTSTELEGLRLGGGVEVAVSDNAYVKAEYRYTDFNRGVGQHGGLVGIGFRF